jgi:hypothetical protein
VTNHSPTALFISFQIVTGSGWSCIPGCRDLQTRNGEEQKYNHRCIEITEVAEKRLQVSIQVETLFLTEESFRSNSPRLASFNQLA